MGSNNIYIYMDSDDKATVGLIAEKLSYNTTLMHLISDCRKLPLNFKRFKLTHIWKTNNVVRL